MLPWLLGIKIQLTKFDQILAIHLIPQLLPLLKDTIKESAIDKSIDGHAISAASASVPVAYAIIAAYQFRWFISQVCISLIGT